MTKQAQINFLLLIFVIVLFGFLFWYFQGKFAELEKQIYYPSVTQPMEAIQQGPHIESTLENLPLPQKIIRSIEINQGYLSPAGMTVSPEDKIEFKLKNNTEAEAIFKASSDLGIGEDIALQSNEEKSLTFTSPPDSGEYKFIITTAQADLEGLLMVR